MDFSLEVVIAAIISILVPILLWCWKVSSSQSILIKSLDELTEMHLDESSVFSTARTNELLEQHMHQEEGMHRATVEVLKDLNRTIKELTHYIRWSTEQTTKKKPPPFVSEHQK